MTVIKIAAGVFFLTWIVYVLFSYLFDETDDILYIVFVDMIYLLGIMKLLEYVTWWIEWMIKPL